MRNTIRNIVSYFLSSFRVASFEKGYPIEHAMIEHLWRGETTLVKVFRKSGESIDKWRCADGDLIPKKERVRLAKAYKVRQEEKAEVNLKNAFIKAFKEQ